VSPQRGGARSGLRNFSAEKYLRPMKIKILYEDKDILAIEKPAGMVVDAVLEHYPKFILAHRLDRETSGVMLLAKNEKAHEFLKEQFQARTIKKIYHAIVNGHPRAERGVINRPIGRSPKDFRRWLAGRGARGELREAITEYRVLKKFEEGNKKEKHKFSFIEVRPKTGRTHQIRVHMKFANYPVACDKLYNPDGACPKGIKRVALHASSIEFTNLKGEKVKVESKLPKEFLFA
jgi:23S rRNA pseudouridine1911/1915/1917 synthase